MNVVKHTAASTVLVELHRDPGSARLRVSDDGRGMGDVDLSGRLAEGHLRLASRRIRIEAVGGALSLYPAEPNGTVADVVLPLSPTPSAADPGELPRATADGAVRQSTMMDLIDGFRCRQPPDPASEGADVWIARERAPKHPDVR